MQYRAYWENEREGELDGVSINKPYPRREALQRKRCLAQASTTTYVYDYPELFREALGKLWTRHMELVQKSLSLLQTQYRHLEGTAQQGIPVLASETIHALQQVKQPTFEQLLVSCELVLDARGQLQKTSRLPGECPVLGIELIRNFELEVIFIPNF